MSIYSHHNSQQLFSLQTNQTQEIPPMPERLPGAPLKSEEQANANKKSNSKKSSPSKSQNPALDSYQDKKAQSFAKEHSGFFVGGHFGGQGGFVSPLAPYNPITGLNIGGYSEKEKSGFIAGVRSQLSFRAYQYASLGVFLRGLVHPKNPEHAFMFELGFDVAISSLFPSSCVNPSDLLPRVRLGYQKTVFEVGGKNMNLLITPSLGMTFIITKFLPLEGYQYKTGLFFSHLEFAITKPRQKK